MRKALAPILFDDDHRSSAQSLRKSVVDPARRSTRGSTEGRQETDGRWIPVLSFRSLLSHLGALTKNTVRIASSESTFSQYSEPTAVQHTAFELLGISPRM